MPFSQILNKLENGQSLSEGEAYEMQAEILSGKVSTNELLQVFESMSGRIASGDELAGVLRASRESMRLVEVGFPTLDTCSTGGDGLQVFNISTISGVVCAAAGVPVAKHGNKSATSSTGSFDLLERLGVNFDLDAKTAGKMLKEVGLVFLFAPRFHPAFRFVKEARRQFGRKTYFNFLGPLLNPVRSEYQVIGVSDLAMIPAMGQALLGSGSKRVWLLQGQDGLNEISPSGLTKVWEFVVGQSEPEEFVINPQTYGLPLHSLKEIGCNSVEESKKIFWQVLRNEAVPAVLDTVLLNAAAGLYVFGKVKNFLDGVNLAREVIQSGEAREKFERVLSF